MPILQVSHQRNQKLKQNKTYKSHGLCCLNAINHICNLSYILSGSQKSLWHKDVTSIKLTCGCFISCDKGSKPATSSSLIPAILLVMLLGLAIVLQLQFSACTCTRSVPTLIYSPCQLCWLMRKQTKYPWPSVNRILSIFTTKSLISSLNLFYNLKQLKTARKSL